MGSERRGDGDGYLPLFETREATGRIAYRLYVICMFVGVCMVWVYRATHIPREGEDGRWAWIGLFAADLWFSFYWILSQSVRWNCVYRSTFKERLSQRYEDKLPGVDVFVCTADPFIEPPILVINTVLSVMAYNYPPEKLSVYLSDDGGSDLTFYALLEATRFTKHWIPFCKKFKVEPRCPAAYFSTMPGPPYLSDADEWWALKKMYEEMENRIDTAVTLGRIPEEVCQTHRGFSEWNSGITPRDHRPILQILIDGRGDPKAVDSEGVALPTLVYLAREKRPQHPHNFKAGAMNSLIRVSSEISNGQIILNVDCDMYSNNSGSVRDALCFFMDEENGREIAYVQFPQNYNNMTKNDLYATSFKIISEVDLPGLDGIGGPLYVGTGCFHRRESLCGGKYDKDDKKEWEKGFGRKVDESSHDLEEKIKSLATCKYEENTQWGNEMGLKYGCPVEDVITGLSIQCRGWKSMYFNPVRKGFLGVAPTTLAQALVQHKRWSEGDLQIFTFKYCPFVYGHGKIKLALQMGYGIYCLWAPNSFPTLFYVIFPSLCLYKGISLFPPIYSPWFLPFMYVIIAEYAYSVGESLWYGMTLKGWWNEQRIWLMRRTTSYLFAVVDTLLLRLGFAKSAFIITAKAIDNDVSQRYEQEIIEFGSNSPMFTILASLAMLNLFCLVGGATRVMMDSGIRVLEQMMLQFLLCGLLVLINVPIYQGLFFRKDKGRLPTSLAIISVFVAVLACLIPIY